ncbi:MAG: hypothetical protein AAF802_30960, partial [Planctomycetota bacterium]
QIEGPKALNPFLHGDLGDGAFTPYIPNLLGGAQVYGIVDGLNASELDFNPQTIEQDAAESGALVATLRLPGGLADIGLGDHPAAINFVGYDWVLVANVSSLDLADPMIGIGVHSDGVATETTINELAFDDIDRNSDGPQVLRSLNAGDVWATLVPNDGSSPTVRVNMAIGGDPSLITSLDAVELAQSGEDQTAYITATKPILQTIGVANDVESFGGLTEIATSPPGVIYALSETRDALLVIDGTDFSILQVVENNVDGITSFTDLRSLTVGSLDSFVQVTTGVNGVATFARDEASGLLTLNQTQFLDFGFDPFNFTPFSDGVNLVNLTATDFGGTDTNGTQIDATVLATFRFADDDSDDVIYRLKAFTREAATGILNEIPDSNPDDAGKDSEIDLAVGETVLDVSAAEASSLQFQVLIGSENGYRVVPYDIGPDLFMAVGGIAHDATFRLNNADKIIVTGDFVHVLSSTENFVTTLRASASGPAISYEFVQTIANGRSGVSGMLAPTDLTVSPGEELAYITGRDSDSVIVARLDGSGAMVQRLRNNSAGVEGFVAPVGLVSGASGGSLVAATLGDSNTAGGLVSFVPAGQVGNAPISDSGVRNNEDELYVLSQPFGEAESRISQWRFLAQEDSFGLNGPTEIRPLILEPSGDDWVVTGIGAPRVLSAQSGGVLNFDFELEFGSDVTTGRYFGWYASFTDGRPEDVANGPRGSVGYEENVGASVFRLDLSTGDAIHAITDFEASDVTFGNAITLDRRYSIQA